MESFCRFPLLNFELCVWLHHLIDPLLPYGQIIAETDGSNCLVAEYVYGQDRVSLRRSGATHYYLADGQGSTRLLTDSTGTATDSTVYTAFGETLFSSGSTLNAFLYTGEQVDGNSAFYYLRSRWMDPKSGHFASVDPFNGGIARPLSLNKYLYAESNPVWKTDPSGKFGIDEVLATISLMNILASMPRASTAKLLPIDIKVKSYFSVVDDENAGAQLNLLAILKNRRQAYPRI